MDCLQCGGGGGGARGEGGGGGLLDTKHGVNCTDFISLPESMGINSD